MLKKGKNLNVSNEDYHGDREYTSSSALKLIRKDEIEFLKKYVLGQKDEEINPNFEFGTYMHTAVLEPHLLESETAIYDMSRRGGKKWEDFCAENKGKTIITRPESLLFNKIMANYKNHKIAQDLFSGGEAEVTYAGELMGFKSKVRADYIKDNALIDLKTTSAPLTYANIQSVINSYDYDMSAAFYIDIINQFREVKIDNMFFVFASKKTYDILVVRLSPEYLECGRRKYREAIEKYFKLQKEGFFTIKNLDDMILEIKKPEWL